MEEALIAMGTVSVGPDAADGIDAFNDLGDIAAALAEFKVNLPGWGYVFSTRYGERHAFCYPDIFGTDTDMLDSYGFNDAFRFSDIHPNGTCARALRVVMKQALLAIEIIRSDVAKAA